MLDLCVKVKHTLAYYAKAWIKNVKRFYIARKCFFLLLKEKLNNDIY
jgi:hypothetical protein